MDSEKDKKVFASGGGGGGNVPLPPAFWCTKKPGWDRVKVPNPFITPTGSRSFQVLVVNPPPTQWVTLSSGVNLNVSYSYRKLKYLILCRRRSVKHHSSRAMCLE